MTISENLNCYDTQSPRPDNFPQFHFNCEPLADSGAVVISNNVRVTVLSTTVLRIEYSGTENFEDRASQLIWFRRRPPVPFDVLRSDNKLEVITGSLRLVCGDTRLPFSNDTLYIDLLSEKIRWRFGDVDSRNLGGTVRTLDRTNGPVELPPGLLSRSGWTLLDDSGSLVYNENFWPSARRNNSTDLYFFGYGEDYKSCLKEFCALSGSIALPPRFAFGCWWSRYWAYTQKELISLVEDFEKHRIPLSVCVVDMDWHIVNNPHHKGWTGYTWNKELFPDPQGFFAFLHKKGVRSSLNLHPHDGVHPHEDAYASMAELMGIDSACGEAVPFDSGDPKFMSGYFERLHHPLEKQGVDFWWIDWQQGEKSSIEGLDPLYQLNHLHFLDLGRSGKRPLILSRYCGLGGQRYPVGFSGDTHVTWESLAFQPVFTAASANAGFSYWSHDIGGHYKGREDPELYVRWIQFGVFSPIFRIHSANNPLQDRRPFVYDSAILELIRDSMRLRHSLIPYIYSCCRLAEKESLPLVRCMYMEHPEKEEAYNWPGQYYFGTSLVAAPFVTPADPLTKLSSAKVWLPEGEWYNFFTGEYIPGGQAISVRGGLETIPVYANAGAIIVCADDACLEADKNPHSLYVKIFAGANGRFVLYEDDGDTLSYRSGKFCETVLTQKWSGGRLEVSIEPPTGESSLVPQKRSWTLEVFGITDKYDINCRTERGQVDLCCVYDYARQCLRAAIGKVDVKETITVEFEAEKIFKPRTPQKSEGQDL